MEAITKLHRIKTVMRHNIHFKILQSRLPAKACEIYKVNFTRLQNATCKEEQQHIKNIYSQTCVSGHLY